MRNVDKKISKERCGHPERLKGKPGKCTPEKIKKCHGDVSEKHHPCDTDKKSDKSI